MENENSWNPEEVRAQVRRILSSGDFDASERNRRFLEYVVEETIEGRADRIKAYSIATSVFGRQDSFDPQQDAIVRIEAGRMRRSLEHYYLIAGLGDTIRIMIPVGSYVPRFSRVNDAQSESSSLADQKTSNPKLRAEPAPLPSVLVDEFEVDGADEAARGLARGLKRHVTVGLTRFADLFVASTSTASALHPTADFLLHRDVQGVDFLLTGAVAVAGGRLYVEALLMEMESGQYIWSDRLERDLAACGMMQIRAEVADHIVRAIAQPTGAIFSHRSRTGASNRTASCEPYESVIRFHDYWRTFDRDQHESVRLSLERAIIKDPYHTEAFVCLSLMYSNIVRFELDGVPTSLNPLRRAIALARRAIQISPNSSRGHFALAVAYWFGGHVKSAIEALETSRALNPNDTEVTAELGLRQTLQGNWDDGIALINLAYQQNAALHGGYRIGLSIWHFVEGRYEAALSEAWKIDAPGVLYPYIMIAISAARLGRLKEAEAALASLRVLAPDYGNQVVHDLQQRNVHPALIEKLVRGLQQAGLSCGNALFQLVTSRRDMLEASVTDPMDSDERNS